MSLPALRVGDINAGAGVLITGSFDVMVNNRPFSRLGDVCTPHPGLGKKIHPPNPLIMGALTVMVNGRPAGMLTRIEALLHPYITGSFNVIVGGGISGGGK